MLTSVRLPHIQQLSVNYFQELYCCNLSVTLMLPKYTHSTKKTQCQRKENTLKYLHMYKDDCEKNINLS